MKSYREVIKERYDGSEREIHPYNNIYSILNPVGFYADKKLRQLFHNAFTFIRNRNADLTQFNILDIGCGKGSTTRFFCELTGNPQNIYGLDLSEHRIQCASEINPKINYIVGDIVNPPSFPIKFDVISALDVFMHLSEKKDIILALCNINKQLKNGGYFIWYDAYAADHFKTSPYQDHSGFHPQQMIELAKEAGFKKNLEINLFKKIFGKYHSLYLIKRFPEFMINLLEAISFGSPGNMMMIFIKST